MKKRLFVIAAGILLTAVLVTSCDTGMTDIATYTVTYNDNGATGGTVPEDSTAYAEGASVTVLGNTGALSKTNYSFTGWNTAANGSGSVYTAGRTFTMSASDITLYAVWSQNVHTLYFDANGGEGIMAAINIDEGDSVAIPDCTFTLEGSGFAGWNTGSEGNGTGYSAGSSLTMGNSDIRLYAQWTKDLILTITSSVDSGYTASDSFTVDFSFNKSVTGFESDDIAVSNGTLTGFSGSDDSYSATVTAAAEGIVIVTVAAAAASDSYGYSSAETACTVHYDLTAPDSIVPIVTTAGAGQITVAWSEPADDESFDHVMLLYNNTDPVTLEKGVAEYTFDSLITGSSYCPIIKAVDAAGNESSYREGAFVTLYDDTLRNVYFVATAMELAAMSEDLSGYYILESNITLSSWTPVGSSTAPFKGIVAGQYRTISGLTISAGSYRGFLGNGSSAYVRDLSFSEAVLPTTTGSEYCGLLAGKLSNSTIENVEISGTVGTAWSGSYIGGLAGYITGTTITSCRAYVDVKGYTNCGGLAGGVAGTTKITLSAVEGISSPGVVSSYYVGGLVGYKDYGTLTIDQSYTNIDVAGQDGDASNISGLCGYARGTMIITDFYTRGYVSNPDGNSTGGLFGYEGATISISNTYVQGLITSSGTYTGGLIGFNNGGTISLSEVFYSDNTGQSSPGDGFTAEEPIADDDLKGLVSSAGWDTSIWGTNSGVNDGYPYLLNNPFN